jgi:hypothetical protein
LRLFLSRSQRGQQHRCEDGENGDDNEQHDEGESTAFGVHADIIARLIIYFNAYPSPLAERFCPGDDRICFSRMRDLALPFTKSWLAQCIQSHQQKIHLLMKKNNYFARATILIGIALAAALNFGCKKNEAPPAAQNPTASEPKPASGTPADTAIVSAQKTSFNEVTAQLDPGGNFYLYLGTAQWTEHLSSKVENWRKTFTGLPDAKAEDVANINKAFDTVENLVKDSGVEDITGFGLSSIEIEPGLYRNKALLHHYSGTGNGFLWKLAGGPPHPLTGLDLLPANTAFAIFSDADMTLLWSVVKDEAGKSGFPQANDFLQQLPAQFEKNTQVKWDTFLNSLGGEFGIAITLDESNTVPVPLPSGLIQVPEPGILLVVKVSDDTIFNFIDAQLKKNPNQQVVSVDDKNLKMRTVPIPLPLAISLRPTAASSGGYLLIASSDALARRALAVKSGEQPGLKSTAEFKRLSQGIPDQGNQFSYVSAKFGQTVMEIQKQAITAAAAQNSGQAQMAWMRSFMSPGRAAFSYSVGMNTSEGCLTVGNGNQSAAALALLPAVAVPGLLAAIAVPNFVKARATSQENACINNLRMIDAAKHEWALGKNKQATDVPTEDDLKPYLMNGRFPVCPQGGTYTINAVNQPPTCSIPGHKLP